MKTTYGLNEKVIASPVSKSRKGYSTKDKIFKFPENVFFFFFVFVFFFCFFFFSLSRDNAGCQVKNKMALNSHDMSWHSFLHTCIIYLLQTEFHSCC